MIHRHLYNLVEKNLEKPLNKEKIFSLSQIQTFVYISFDIPPIFSELGWFRFYPVTTQF
ncbi:hypothetical protein LEP1GSC150_4114 [Leptospira interrogans serovar Copenhageni str. LT2050]|uniref:Uncharacterized protein n=1 Tax=Leptospira interrogans serovar Copenhageni str. LT2050 TaxID=1001598 RepID=M3ID64_LEPIT|nr:hypothetical protein LEP1GSC150_4114 [Leptospira interrogans serovar Copenhageni str. LT2050]